MGREVARFRRLAVVKETLKLQTRTESCLWAPVAIRAYNMKKSQNRLTGIG